MRWYIYITLLLLLFHHISSLQDEPVEPPPQEEKRLPLPCQWCANYTRENLNDEAWNSIRDLYHALDGQNWLDNNNWLDENTSICEWANFVCILDVDEGEDPNGDYHDRLDLIQVFLIGNNISGTLPANIGGLNNWHPNIKFNVLYISHNSELTGTIPESFGQLKNLAALELGHNNLEGTLPDVWDNGFLRYFSVVNNSRLGGLLPASLFNPNMGLLRIPYCNFTGPLPVYQRLTNLNDFSAEFNRLNGSLQSLFENLDESIAQIRLHQNQFSGLVPKVTKEQRIGWKNLRTLWMSYNQLSGVYSSTDFHFENLVHLFLDHNQLTGDIQEVIKGFTGAPHLVALDLSHNQFWGEIDFEAGWGSNFFSLANEQGALFYANFEDNPIRASSSVLPNTLYLQQSARMAYSPQWYCATILVEPLKRSRVLLPNNYFHYANCFCSRGFLGRPPDACAPCFKHATCPDSGDVSWERGYYPIYSDNDTLVDIKECSDTKLFNNPTISQCSPEGCYLTGGVRNFDCIDCAAGSGGRLCSHCDCPSEGGECYYWSSSRCSRCSVQFSDSTLAGIGLGAGMFVVVVLVIAILIVTRQADKPSRFKKLFQVQREISAYTKLLLIYIQTMIAIMEWPHKLLPQVATTVGLFNLRTDGFGLICLFPTSWRENRFWLVDFGYVMTPVFAFVLITIACLLAGLIKRVWTKCRSGRSGRSPSIITDNDVFDGDREPLISSEGSEMFSMSRIPTVYDKSPIHQRTILEVWILLSLFVLYFIYFGIATSILENFHCQFEPETGNYYLASAQWMKCASGSTWESLRTLSVIAAIPYVIGTPVLFGVILFVLRQDIYRSIAETTAGMFSMMRGVRDHISHASSVLYGNYRVERYWFELVIIARRLAFACVLALLPASSQQLPIIIILTAALVAHYWLLPFKTGMANRAEEFILLSLIISYTAQATSKNEVITTMMMALNIITLIGIVALLILNFVMAIRATCCTSDKEQEEEEEEEKEDNAVEIKKNS